MAGAVSSPFTASMFRFDGIKLQELLLYVNKKYCNLLYGLLTFLFLMAIYFAQDLTCYCEVGLCRLRAQKSGTVDGGEDNASNH